MARTTSPSIPVDELPFWMRQATQGFDWGFFLAIGFALLAAWPFILQPGLPRTNASENYVFMAQDFSDTLNEGRLYPRWSPHVLGGYGAPIPNYYPPVAPYLTAVLEVLFTNDIVVAARVVYVLSFMMAGAAVYSLVSRRINASAALLAVVLYVYSPYIALTAPHIRGDLAGVLALALLPLMLSLLDRLLAFNRPLDLALTTLVGSLLLMTHLPTAAAGFILAILLVFYHGRRAPWAGAWMTFICGIGLAAFFWLPALAEQGLITWQQRPIPNAPRLTFDVLLQAVRPVDLTELAPTPQYKLGWILIACTGVGALVALLKRRKRSFPLLMLVAGASGLVAAATFFPAEVELLGPITLCLSIAGSACAALEEHLPERWQRLTLPALVILVLAGSYTSWLAPRWPESFGSTTPIDQILYEQQGLGIAVLPPGAPLPSTLFPNLSPSRFLINGYQSNNVNKIAPAQGANSRLINVLSHNTHGDRFQIQLASPTQLDILTAYFPGWQATGSVPFRLSRNGQTGLITVAAPKMNGELNVTLFPTQVQQSAWVVSWCTLAVVLLLTIRRIRHHAAERKLTSVLSKADARLIAVVLASFAGVILLCAIPGALIPLHARPGYALDNAIALRSRTDVGLEALAYRVDRSQYRPGEAINMTVYWQALRALPDNYRVQVFLLEPDTAIAWHRSDYLTPGNYPTRRWRTYAYVNAPFQIKLSETIIPGDYYLALEVFPCGPTCDPDQRLTFFNASGSSVGQTLTLPTTITITR